MIYLILLIHWFADFVMQTDWMATNKSKKWWPLTAHVLVYTLFLVPISPLYALVNGIAHFLTDAVTSRITSKLWQLNMRHEFFVVIGLDQLIHVMILVKTLDMMNLM